MSSQALEVRTPDQLQRVEITGDQLTLARNTVASGLQDAEFELFLYDCKRQGVHPLDRLLIPVVTKDSDGTRRLAMWTTIDLLRSRAAESGEYAGSEDAQFEYLEGAVNPQLATVSVYRLVQGQRCMFTATARWSEYFPGDKRGFKWKQSPHIMLGKCAEALALRKAFPKQLASLYAQEEMERVESQPEPEVQPIKKTTPKPSSPQGAPAPNTTAHPVPSEPVQGEVVSGDLVTEKQLKMLFAIQKSANFTDDQLKPWLAAKGVTSRKLIPKAMFQEVIDKVDPEFKFHVQQSRQTEESW